MISFELASIFARLQQPAQRVQAAAALAAWAGARDAIVFGKDSEIGLFLPAPGMVQTLKGGRRWQQFLTACAAQGHASEQMPDPLGGEQVQATGITGPGANAILVFLGGAPDAGQCAALQALGPLLGAKLEIERDVMAAAGHAEAARDSSRRGDALNAALDVNRRELQGAYARLESELHSRREAERKLRDADRRKDEFLAMLAHELRNPLAPISMAAQILRGPINTVRQEQTCQIIERQVNHMKRLLDDLLDVSRVTGGMVALAREPHDMRDIVDDALEQARPLINSREQHLVLNLGQEPLVVLGDGTRLVQIAVNLINNAAKYTPPGGTISIALRLRGDQVLLSVRDSGIGIDDALLPHVFDLFIQGERSSDRSQGGLGLGLALVRSLAERHGGAVSAASEGPGRGSEFEVSLPHATSPLQRAAPIAVPDAPDAPLSIMIVDDNVDAARTLAQYFEAMGHEVKIAFDGRQALALAAYYAPRVLLLDIGLPDMDGYNLARRLHALPNTRDCLTLALTGYGLPEDRERSREAGFDHHLTKPVNAVQLTQLLATA